MCEVIAANYVPARSNPATPARHDGPPRTRTANPPDPPADRAELSTAAAEYPAAEAATEAARVAAIRAQIANGTYLTPDKLDVVVERLFAELTGA